MVETRSVQFVLTLLCLQPQHIGQQWRSVVRESSAKEGSSVEKPTTFLGRRKASTVIPGNVQAFAAGHGSGIADPLLLSSLGPYHEPRHCLTK